MNIQTQQLQEIRDLLALDATYTKVCDYLALPPFGVLEKIRPFLPEGWNSSIFNPEHRTTFKFQTVFTNAALLQTFDRTIRHEKFKRAADQLLAGESLDSAAANAFVSQDERENWKKLVRDVSARDGDNLYYPDIARNIAEQSLTEPEAFEK